MTAKFRAHFEPVKGEKVECLVGTGGAGCIDKTRVLDGIKSIG